MVGEKPCPALSHGVAPTLPCVTRRQMSKSTDAFAARLHPGGVYETDANHEGANMEFGMKFRRMTYVTLAAGLSLLSGCSVFDNDDDDRKAATDTSYYGSVPTNAIRVAQGFDVVRYRASEPARVWIGNDNRRSVITETRVQPGDEIQIDAKGDRVLVNGVAVYSQNLEKNEQHSIFVLSDRAGN